MSAWYLGSVSMWAGELRRQPNVRAQQCDVLLRGQPVGPRRSGPRSNPSRSGPLSPPLKEWSAFTPPLEEWSAFGRDV